MNTIQKYIKEGQFLRRFIILVFGLFFAAMGVSLSVKANLGTSPMGCCPVAASVILGEIFGIELSVGNCMWIMLSLFVLLQIVLLRRNYELIQLTQLIVAYVYGFLTDFTATLIQWINPGNYFEQWLLCLVSIVFLGFGVFLEVKADLVMLSGEGLVLAITKVTNFQFHKVKISMDCCMVAIAIVSTLIALHYLVGAREGTVAAAILVGMVVKFFSKRCGGFLDKFFNKNKAQSPE